MTREKNETNGMMIPTLRYRDATQAIEWLCKAFGFKKHLVVEGEGGGVAHAQLKLDNGMVMLSTHDESEFAQMVVVPGVDSPVTQSPYVVVHDIDAHYKAACDAEAEILMKIADQDYGGRVYVARDPEGHVWSFGSYDPWAD